MRNNQSGILVLDGASHFFKISCTNFCNRTRSNEDSRNSSQTISNPSASSSRSTINSLGGQYGVQQEPQRFTSRTMGLRRLVAWTRSVAPPPLNAPHIRLQHQNSFSSDNTRMASTSAPVSCKAAMSNCSSFSVHCRPLACYFKSCFTNVFFLSCIHCVT